MTLKKYQNPKGGLSAEGRKFYGVKKGVVKAKTPTQIKRKGSFLRRFYAREEVPPLKDPKGRPTRYALAASAWGERVPKTKKDVRRLAKKGKVLLERYRRG